jgi:hypothetical protein
MTESTLRQLQILVERAVRPVRASACSKSKMREELLAHVTAVFEEEVARLANEQAALEQTARRFGNPAELTGQLQESIPTLDSINRFAERFADWVFFQSCESTLRRAVWYTIFIEGVALLLFLFFTMVLLLQGVVGGLPTDALWQIGPMLLTSGPLGFTICFLESSMRRLLDEQTRRSWLQLALVVVGCTIVSMTLGLWAFGVSPNTAIWVFLFMVGFPAVPAWALACRFTARKRCHEDWASLQIE